MLDPVTTRYTEALFNLARSGGLLDVVQGDVDRLSGELASPSVSAFFFDARVSMETRREKIQPLLQGMAEITQNFVNLLFEKCREDVLGHIQQAFHQRMLAERGEAEGVVESARALDPAELAEMGVALGARLGKRVKLENRVVPDLVGGVRVIVESKMLDFSFAGRMDALRKRLLDAPLPSLQEA